MEDLNLSENIQEVAEPVIEEQVETTESEENVEVAEPQVEDKPVQSKEENARFAQERREREASQRARDTFIAEQGYTWQGQPITTEAQYKQALREKELYEKAQEEGRDPNEAIWKAKIEDELNNTKNQLSAYQLKEKCYQQDEKLLSDEKIGPIYKEWREDVKNLSNQLSIDYDTAFTILTRERLADILGKTKVQTQQEVIQKINTNAQTSPGALSSESASTKVSPGKMSEKDFRELQEKVLRGERIQI